MSVVASRTMYAGAVIVMFFAMVILNLLASSSCTQLMKSIGDKEKLLGKLEESYQRESAKWDEMITPERLEHHLVKHGLSMHYAKPAQTIRMRHDGTPYPGQLSLVKAEARVNSRSVALAGTGVRPAAPVATVRTATAAIRPVSAARPAPVRTTPVRTTPVRATAVAAKKRNAATSARRR